ncbi:MAG: DUF2726 domain-containing protein [Syntrophomonadaceae bacterium]|nr:DUF2726 domain-containing protein [Syntrophomonadaceae bacterium]
MGQLIIIIILLITGKLLTDIYKESRNKNQQKNASGEVIDVSGAWIDLSDMPFQPRNYLLSESDMALYLLLQKILAGSNYVVFPKIGLSEILQLKSGTKNPHEYNKRIRSSQADCLLCKLPSLQPVLVVLNQNSDSFGKRALEEAGLQHLIISPDNMPSEELLRQKIQDTGLKL